MNKKYLLIIFIFIIVLTGIFFVIKNIKPAIKTSQQYVSPPNKISELSETITPQTIENKTPIIQNHFPENIENKPTRFLFFGDVMLDRYIKERYGKDYTVLLSKIKEADADFFESYDLIGANLEGAVIKAGAHYLPEYENDFSFAPESLKAFQKNHFNFFNIANNHLTDQGDIGVKETEENMDALGLSHSGSPDGKVDSYALNIIEINKLKVAMLGFSMVYREVDKTAVKQILLEAKTKSDFVVVNIHWGKEYIHDASQTQIEMAHFLIDNGADLIIGHHPHVIQGIEKYQNKLIFYSLGNFIFDQYFSPDTQAGLAVNIDYEKDKIKAILIPFQSKVGIPSLLQAKNKEVLLRNIAGWSKGDEEFKNAIKTGEIKIIK